MGDSFNMIGLRGSSKASNDRVIGSNNKSSKMSSGKVFSKLQNIHSKENFELLDKINKRST